MNDKTKLILALKIFPKRIRIQGDMRDFHNGSLLPRGVYISNAPEYSTTRRENFARYHHEGWIYYFNIEYLEKNIGKIEIL